MTPRFNSPFARRRDHGRGNFRTFHTRDFDKARSGGTLTSQPIYPKRKHNTNTKVPSIKASAVAPADMASNFSTESEMEKSPAKLGLKEEEYDRLVHVHAFRQRHLRTMTGVGRREQRLRRLHIDRAIAGSGGKGAYLCELPEKDEVRGRVSHPNSPFTLSPLFCVQGS